jgi:putative ABC transport system permease protein
MGKTSGSDRQNLGGVVRAVSLLRNIASGLRSLFRKDRVEGELDEELRGFLEMAAEEKMKQGMSPKEALRAVRLERGTLEVTKEVVRSAGWESLVETLWQDLRFAARMLRKSPGFTAVTVLTLALGVGANTAIFTVVNGVILKPLPYPQPDRLVMVLEKQLSDGTLGTVAPANFFDWREQSHSFDKMAAIDPYPDFILNGSGAPQRLTGAAVSSDLFSLLGVHMALGRDFLLEEDRPGDDRVVILSYSTWLHYFGGRSDTVGRQLTLNNTVYLVVGVLPRDFSLVSKASDFQSRNRFDLWTPLALASPPEPWQRGTHPLCVFARLKSGISLQQAQTDLNQVAANLQRLYPADDKERGITAVPLGEHVVANVRIALFTLLAAVGMVLLMACANIANLLLSRAVTRQKEIALRIALGASRTRLAQQLLTESMVLVIFGGSLGLSFACLAVPAVADYLPADLPRASEIAVDGRVLVFSSLISLFTGILFGLLPLLQSKQVNATDSLKQHGRGIAGGQSRLRSALIVGQVAVALVLVVGAGLMTKSFWMLLKVSPGFRTEHILTARLSLPPQYTNGGKFGIGQHRKISAFQQRLLEVVSNIPGVQSAAFDAYPPLSGTYNSWAFDIEGRPAKPVGTYDMTEYRPVSAGYFETVGIPVLRGRRFSPADNEDSPLVVIINDSMARIFWKQENPVGQRLRFDGHEWLTIVGVVADVHHGGLGTIPEPAMYIPYGQIPNVESRPTIILRTSVEPSSITSALRRAVSEVDASVPLDQIETMEQIISVSVGEPRFRTAVLLMFAILALFVASIGLYGVMSYLMSQRTREFGIRIAVGASSGDLLRLVLGQAAKLVSVGIGLGLVGSMLLARSIASLLYGITPFDTATLTGVSLLLAAVALSASYIPARRAASVDPTVALRYE